MAMTIWASRQARASARYPPNDAELGLAVVDLGRRRGLRQAKRKRRAAEMSPAPDRAK